MNMPPMSGRDSRGLPRVVVDDGDDDSQSDDMGDSVSAVYNPATHVLVLHAGQSFDGAVAAVLAVLPGLHPDDARSLVRRHLPRAPDWSPLLSGSHRPQRPAARPRGWPLVLAAVAVVAAIVIGASGWVVMHQEHPRPEAVTLDDRVSTVTRKVGVACRPLTSVAGRCTDAAGRVFLGEWIAGDEGSVMVHLTWGDQRTAVRVFPSEDAAKTWLGDAPTRRMYRGAVVVGRYSVWGTDPELVKAYVRALREAEGARTPGSAPGARPLP